MLEEKKLDEQISDFISIIVSKVRCDNVMGNYDVNKYIQQVFADILNAIYNWNLYDLDSNGRFFRGIDIGDDINGRCFQVTSDNDIEKIRDSVEKYNKYGYYNQYPYFYVLIIGEKKKYSGSVKEYDNFKFSIKDNVIDIKDVLIAIKDIRDIGRKQVILNVLTMHVQRNYKLYASEYLNANNSIVFPKNYIKILKWFAVEKNSEESKSIIKDLSNFINRISGFDVNIRSIIMEIIRNKADFDDRGIYFNTYPINQIFLNMQFFNEAVSYMRNQKLLEDDFETGTEFWRLSVCIETSPNYRIDYLSIVTKYCIDYGIEPMTWLLNLNFSIFDEM